MQIEPTPEMLEAREFLRSRILRRAIAEGHPLSPLEVEYLDSDHLPNEREIMARFDREYEHQGYMDHISGLLRRALEAEAVADPSASARYKAMTLRLEKSPSDLILYSCAVMAISEQKSLNAWLWLAVILFLALVAAYYLKTHGLLL